MRSERSAVVLNEALSQNPALTKLAEMAEQLAGIKLIAMLSDGAGWQQVRIGEPARTPLFCRMMQGSRDGVRHCHTNHLLMLGAAGGSVGMNEQACHAGPRALVTPMKRPLSKGSALISTCLFTSRNRAQAWKAARTRGLELGLDLKQLRAAFDQLPVLPKHKLEQVRSILAAATEIMSEVKSRFDAEEKLASRQSENTPVLQLQAALVHEVGVDTESAQANPIRTPCNMDHQQGPALIRAVANLIASKPEAPYSAAAIAAAARITPNHFSALFHRWTGKGFLEFLTTHRIRAAQTLLQNLSLTINEVARRAGFEDANYFARRFKQATGLTPREWRNALPVKGTRNRKAATSQAWLTVQSVACT